MLNDVDRRSRSSKTTLIGDSQIPAALGQTITGALANIPFPFGIDSNGNYGYKKAGADSVTPFSDGEGGYACITTGYDTYAYPIGEDYNPAVFSRNSAANYTSNVDGDMYVIFTSFCMTSVSFSGSVSVNNTVVYTAPNGSQVSPQLSSAIPIHKGDVISITGGTSAHHNSYFTTLYVKNASSIDYSWNYIAAVQANSNSGCSATYCENGHFGMPGSGGEWVYVGTYLQMIMPTRYTCTIKANKSFKGIVCYNLNIYDREFTAGEVIVNSFAYNVSPVLVLGR